MKVLPTNFYTMPRWSSMTMDRKDLKELLLSTGGYIIACGEMYNIKNEHLGAEVYKVFLKSKWKH